MPSIFTKIKNKEVEVSQPVIYSDNLIFIIVSDRPHTEGHLLIIPHKEEPCFENLDEETLSHMMKIIKKFSLILKEIYNPERIGLAIDGFEVAHTHVHLMPINKENGGIWHIKDFEKISLEDMIRVSNKIETAYKDKYK